MLLTDRLRSREDRPLPSVYDVEGAAYGLSRLHSLYGVDTAKMVEDGVIESNLQRHQVGAVVTSKPSVKKLEGKSTFCSRTTVMLLSV